MVSGSRPEDKRLRYLPKGLYIGGKWVPGARGKALVSINPATGERLADVPSAGEEEVHLAVQAAQQGFGEWRSVAPWERAALVEQLADRIAAQAEELALLDSYDSGNILSAMRSDVKATVAVLKCFAELAREMEREKLDTGPSRLNFRLRQPFGVVAKINPFNHPFRFAAGKAAAPLVTGNSIIIKPPEQAPLSTLRFAELCGGLFPPGAVNVVTGDAVTGSALVRHPGVRRIAFIGSVETGRIIAREAAREIKSVSFALGGKNPIIIFPDAVVDQAVDAIVGGMNLNRQRSRTSSPPGERLRSRPRLHRCGLSRRLEPAPESPPRRPATKQLSAEL